MGLIPVLLVALAACGGGGDYAVPFPTPALGPPAASVAPLRDSAATAGKLVGAAVQSGYLASEPDYAAALSRHFSYLTAEYEMKWDPIQRERGVFDFSGGDAIVAFAEANGMRVKGHALVWHGATPSWVGTLPPRDLRDAVANHIRTVARHYRDHVAAWDVVNEAVAAGPGPRLHRGRLPHGPRGRPEGASLLQRVRRRGERAQVGPRLRARQGSQAGGRPHRRCGDADARRRDVVSPAR